LLRGVERASVISAVADRWEDNENLKQAVAIFSVNENRK